MRLIGVGVDDVSKTGLVAYNRALDDPKCLTSHTISTSTVYFLLSKIPTFLWFNFHGYIASWFTSDNFSGLVV